MRVLAINGSPREGHTAALLEEMDGRVRARGHHMETIRLAELDIEDCQACMSCKEGEPCPLEDDLAPLLDRIDETDLLVLASPVYMGAETGPMKCFLDRLYRFLVPSEGDRIYDSALSQGKKALAFFPCANPRGHRDYAALEERYEDVLGLLGLQEVRSCIISGTAEMEDIRDCCQSRNLMGLLEDMMGEEDPVPLPRMDLPEGERYPQEDGEDLLLAEEDDPWETETPISRTGREVYPQEDEEDALFDEG
ncbi:MAG: flavodoxin family protein [Methanomassiliicoccales archaeon]